MVFDLVLSDAVDRNSQVSPELSHNRQTLSDGDIVQADA